MDHKWADWVHNPYRQGGPQHFRAGPKSAVAQKWADWLHNPCPGVSKALERRTNSEVAQKWADWLHNPYRLGGPQHLRGEDKISSGPQVGGLAT